LTAFGRRFQDVSQKVEEAQNEHRGEIRRLYEEEARKAMTREIRPIERAFPQEPVRRFLSDVLEDVVTRRLKSLGEPKDFTRLYRVNLVQTHEADGPPWWSSRTPHPRTSGSVEREFHAGSVVRSDHLMIRAGNLLRADGGFLIVEARDVLVEPGAWKMLLRTLRTGKLEIVPPELTGFWLGPVQKPEPIEINVKVVLLGDPELYYALDSYDPDFPHLFKVLADFDTTIPRDERGARHSPIPAHIGKEASPRLLPERGVGTLRTRGSRGRAPGPADHRLGRILDIGRGGVSAAGRGERRSQRRDSWPSASQRRADFRPPFRQLVAEGRCAFRSRPAGPGERLAVIRPDPWCTFPLHHCHRAGTAGAIDIEREAGYPSHPPRGSTSRATPATSATHPPARLLRFGRLSELAGTDGTPRRGEICCLLSALTGVPPGRTWP
jgi:ATP-dependent Lon protease